MTPLGAVPEHFDWPSSLCGERQRQAREELFSVDKARWLEECEELTSYFRLFGPRFPEELSFELSALKARLSASGG